jgi:pimeloyl-ACP methyl ester carboxylesterase
MKRLFLLLGLIALFAPPLRADVLVLVHGYMSDSRTWEVHGVLPVLAANGWQPAGVLAVTPDGQVPNLGVVEAERLVYSVNLMASAPLLVQARQLAAQVAAVRVRYPDERLILVGHSAGGVVARMLVLNGNPYRVDSLISIASPHLGTPRAADGLELVDFNPFFCPGPGLEFMKTALVGNDYDYLKYSRATLVDLLPAESGNVLAWLNQQPHADIDYYAVVRGAPYGGDNVVPAYSQDMNNVPALRGRARLIPTPAGHSLNPADGQLLADLLAN